MIGHGWLITIWASQWPWTLPSSSSRFRNIGCPSAGLPPSTVLDHPLPPVMVFTSRASACLCTGFVFGCYDFVQVLASPIFGYLTDRYGERPVIIFAVLANTLGNALYSLSYAAETPYLILVGRLLAGLGSSSLSTGLSFITRTVCPPVYSAADQINEIADYKVRRPVERWE
jgi:MFS family permease